MNILGDNGVSDNDFILASSTGGASVNQVQQPGVATEPGIGANDGPAGTALSVLGTDSLFNPFYIFRYSKFGKGTSAETTGNYDVTLHRNLYREGKKLDTNAEEVKRRAKFEIQNPTAAKIIEWTNQEAERGKNHNGPLYPYPYSLNDFLWCKWYGKIPNNRLLTLRRYPIPVEDNLAIAGEKLPLVPIAQAVTWWGTETSNRLSDVLGMTYSLNWRWKQEAKVEDVQGNEIKVDELLAAAGIPEGATRTALRIALGSNPNNPFQSGYDEKIKEWTKQSWETGAYWNRVKGPVNVIHETVMRDRGFTFTHNIKLTFEYNLRSFGNINPKVAMLDLISNFLSLTYNKATFWGGSYRYYQQTGYILPGFNSDALEKGDYVNGLKSLIAESAQGLAGKATDLKNWWNNVQNDIQGKDEEETARILTLKLASTKLANDVLGKNMQKLHQDPLKLRALLDGRAVGEWHLMVGNPLEPLAVMGNLCLKSSTISFSEELGADDFPVSVKFVVELEPGRARAKQDIESMFNLGAGDLAFTALAPPASAMNTFGEYNSAKANQFAGMATSATNIITTNPDKSYRLGAHFESSVTTRYGAGFGKSPILTDYFTRLETKD
jgi:hypothetical protein